MLDQCLPCGYACSNINPPPSLRLALILAWMAHETVIIDYNISSALKDVVEWAKRDDNHDEVVLLAFQKCADPKREDENDALCKSLTYDAAVEAGFHTDQIIMDCPAFSNITVGEALTHGRKHSTSGATAGILLLIGGSRFNGCKVNSYDEDISCFVGNHDCTITPHNAIPQQHANDTAPLPLFSPPGQALYDHIVFIANLPLGEVGSSSPLVGVSAHFQYTFESILKGSESSIVKNDEAFNTNARVACWVRAGHLANINLVLVDNVCNSGPYLRDELLKYKNVQGLSSRIPSGSRLHCDPVVYVELPTEAPSTLSPTLSTFSPTLSPSPNAANGLRARIDMNSKEVLLPFLVAILGLCMTVRL
jgi:hypothetical protein